VDQDTQQFDGNNPQSEATPEVASDTGQEMPSEAQGKSESATASSEPSSSMSSDERKAALEAIIYAADEPATIEQLAKALSEPKAEVQIALDELIASYASDTRGIEIRGVAGGYKMYTKPQHHDLVRRFIKSLRPPLRLTMPALETLAVISYKQPVTAPEIQEIRGVNTSGVIKTLLDKKLITTAGRKEVIGRPILYRTSKEFLMRFGLSDLGELPSLKEFEALAREALGTDEGVAEGETGDESVLDSIEPTEAEAAAELEAAASEDPNAEPGAAAASKAGAAAAGAEESSAPRQFEQSISPDVVEAIAAVAEPEPAAAEPVAEASESQNAEERQQAHSVAEMEQAAETAAHPSEQSSDSVEAVAQPHESMDSEPAEPAQSGSTQAVGLSMESPDSEESYAETEATEQEISDEILAQLTQGIEIEVSTDSLAALSATDIPAEDSPAEFYSSDAEPERQPLPATESATGQSSPEAESTTEPEKSRGAAAGE
jgi:segregation and condensation protein B